MEKNKSKSKSKNMMYGWAVLGLMIVFYIVLTWSDLMNGEFFSKGNMLMLVIMLGGGFQLLTWRNEERAKKDEMGKHIVYRSTVLSYRILTAALFVLWLVDRNLYHQNNEFGNVFLFIGICLSLVLLPVLQLMISRKYR